jgi:iron(III) transport system substrate-binding protein
MSDLEEMARRAANSSITRRTALRSVVVGGVWLAAAACGGTGSSPTPSAAAASDDPALKSLLQAARAEGTVSVYSSASPDVINRLNAAFTAKYAIKTDLTRLASGALTTRFAAEANGGKVVDDVLQTSDTAFLDQAKAKNWLLKTADLPAAKSWPTKYWDGIVALSALEPISITYNTQLVKSADIPKKWTDLVDPKFKGKILFVDPRGVAVWAAWCLLMKQTYGDSFLTKLGQQNLKLVASAIPGVQSLAAGEAWLLTPSAHWGNVSLIAQGAPIEDSYPSPTTGIEQFMGVAANSPHPNAAKLYLNYMLTIEGQEAMNKELAHSVLPGVKGGLALPASYVSPDINGANAQSTQMFSLLGLK